MHDVRWLFFDLGCTLVDEEAAHECRLQRLVDALVHHGRRCSIDEARAALAAAAIGQGKHVFVEKPLALTLSELHSVAAALETSSGSLMVGFNRRFAPDYVRLREWFQSRSGTASILYRINAGWMPQDNWIMDVREGGRFLGELCHYVDLAMDLAGSPIKQIYASAPGGAGRLSSNGVSMSPGKIAQARMPWGRSSALIACVSPASPNLDMT